MTREDILMDIERLKLKIVLNSSNSPEVMRCMIALVVLYQAYVELAERQLDANNDELKEAA